jgi:hypothetical protein
MTKMMQAVQLALRERQRVILLFGIWALVTVMCAAVGPFGTFDALALPARFAYWGVIAGVSVLGSLLPLGLKEDAYAKRLAAWATFVIGLSALNFGLNSVVFADWWDASQFFYMLLNVTIVVAAVHVVFWLINFARPVADAPDVDAQTRFLRRVPLEVRGPLVRIEAQDHYLNVVTTKGSALILMRLSEAVEELRGLDGILTHRSHWISIPEVTAHRRDKSRDLLVMSDGSEIPVSRSNRLVVKEAGLF